MKKILRHDRVRKIDGGFSYIPQRFMTDGFLESLSQKELLLYLFLVLRWMNVFLWQKILEKGLVQNWGCQFIYMVMLVPAKKERI